ncbi:hypothetical protein OH76DRAFT_1412357 [Lentinus brumalis]|uniref:Uncharacterized protein n=1 Tax=Lentinus brumalis TaxID=2498619 RepID=A0A371CLJ6_9APHY|nr:hypothetical protein OH76DRAFT_1412357 [Polyporus brumalis]
MFRLVTDLSRVAPLAQIPLTTIRTLDPTKLTAEDHLTSVPWEGSGTDLCRDNSDDDRIVVAMLRSPDAGCYGQRSELSPGFLDYHQPPRAPPLAGALRFRITPSNNPASFPAGLDFMIESVADLPWDIPLRIIAGSPDYAPIRRLLTTIDRPVTQEVMDLAWDPRRVFPGDLIMSTQYLHAFGQPFTVHFDYDANHHFGFVGEDCIKQMRIPNATCFEIRRSRACRAVSGVIILSPAELHAVLSGLHSQSIPGSASQLYACCASHNGTPSVPIRGIKGQSTHRSSPLEKVNYCGGCIRESHAYGFATWKSDSRRRSANTRRALISSSRTPSSTDHLRTTQDEVCRVRGLGSVVDSHKVPSSEA